MKSIVRSFGLGAAVGLVCGVASALFLTALEHATSFRESHEWLVYLLPLAGLAIGLGYDRWGASVKGGNDLVLGTIHEGGAQIPLRMVPMVLCGTVVTHLFGGSAGREGTAVQMGASLADWIAHRAHASAQLRRQLLIAGMAGGFGAVFGTPYAGVLFGLEVVRVGRREYTALVPALVAAFVGDLTTRRLGVHHTLYPTLTALPLGPGVAAKLVVLGVAMGLVTVVFVELTHRLKRLGQARIPRAPWRMFVGGLFVVALWKLLGTSEYLGLGVPLLTRAFADPGLPAYAFAAKLLFTSVTLGSGFVGGEVTPLFIVGATLGSVLARMLGLPIELGAGVGMAAVFGSAANTPLALTVMAIELLGVAVLPHVTIVCAIAFFVSGRRSIYAAQRG